MHCPSLAVHARRMICLSGVATGCEPAVTTQAYVGMPGGVHARCGACLGGFAIGAVPAVQCKPSCACQARYLPWWSRRRGCASRALRKPSCVLF